MLKQLLTRRPPLPHVIIAQRVIDKMVNASHTYIEDETGEALIGLVKPPAAIGDVPTIYVLETVSPDDSAEREYAKFEQGGASQDEMLWWYVQNWSHKPAQAGSSIFKRRRPPKNEWDYELIHLGDWHRQPGYMVAPSEGDLMTALDLLTDPELSAQFLLAPIVTLDHPATTEPGPNTNYLTVPDAEEVSFTRIDFWYIEPGTRRFYPITPEVREDKELPTLAPQPWHLLDDERLQLEVEKMNEDGLFSSVLLWDTDEKAPMEICFLVARQGAPQMLIVATQWDYPLAMPKAYLAPKATLGTGEVMYDLMARLWPDVKKLEPPVDFQWRTTRHLIDFIKALESAHGLQPQAPVENATAQSAAEPDSPADQTENAL